MDFFVGLWPILKTYFYAFIVLGGLIALGLLTSSLGVIPIIGPFLVKFEQKILRLAIVGAIIVGAWILGNSTGIYHEAARCKLQFVAAQKAAVKTAHTAHSRARDDAAHGVRDPQDTDFQH